MGDRVIITGSSSAEAAAQVTVYNSGGFLEDWPSLGTGRYNHACGNFVNADNKVVREQEPG